MGTCSGFRERIRIGQKHVPPLIPVMSDSSYTQFLLALQKQIEIAFPSQPREHEPVKLIFEVKDVEGERERLESLGVQTLRRPWQQSGEACDAVVPEGNIFQLCSSRADALR